MFCISYAGNDYNEFISILENYPLVELRLDKCGFSSELIQNKFSTQSLVILSFGEKVISESDIKYLLTSIDNSISYIDLNVNFDDKTLALLIDYSRKKQTKIILSYHNYLETPPKNDLIKIIDCCEKYKPDVIKVACKANSMEDCANLLSLYYDTATRVPEISKKLICISMGNLGKISRIASIYLGAPFTYTAWKKGMETADGQFDIESIQKIMELINDVL